MRIDECLLYYFALSSKSLEFIAIIATFAVRSTVNELSLHLKITLRLFSSLELIQCHNYPD